MSHHGGRGYPRTKQIRAERRARAAEISVESGYHKLTTREKLDCVLRFIAVDGNGEALSQRTRLENRLKAEQEPKATKEKKVVSLDFGGVDRKSLPPNVQVCPQPIYEKDKESSFNRKSNKSRKQ